MTPNKTGFFSALVSAALLLPGPSHADVEPPLTPPLTGFLEAGFGHARLTGGQANWNDQYLRGDVQLDRVNNLNGEISHQSHFGDSGTFVGAGYTRTFNDDWYGFLGAGTSQGGFFLPRLRADAILYKKWLEKKNLVTSAGFFYYRAKTIYFDRALLLGAIYYFESPFVLEVGARLNESNPGSIRSNRGFAALTYGQNKRRYVSLRYEGGTEAYQLIGPGAPISNFASHEVALVWRQWLSKSYGFNLRAVRYENPSYRRSGMELGLFVDF